MTTRRRVHLDNDELPDSVHGRLRESVHVAGYTFERACAQLKWLLRQNRWQSVGPGYDDIDAFVATLDFSDLRASREDRKDLVRQLAAIKAGQRVTARMLGVSGETVARDLGLRATNVAPIAAVSADGGCETVNSLDITATNVAPVIALPGGLKPYYSDDGITIYHGDCRDILPRIPRGLMVTDPPYNVGYHYDEHHDALDPAAYTALLEAVLLMPLVVIHYPEALFPLAAQFHRPPDEFVAWVYHANTPKQWRAVAWFGITPDLSLDTQPYRNPSDKRIRALMEKGREARIYDWWHYEQVKNVSDEKTEHPCQIPMALMRRVLRVTPCDGYVVDPFCGSGTTLVAARDAGRHAIGIDCSEEYCEIAANRLRHPSQLALVTS